MVTILQFLQRKEYNITIQEQGRLVQKVEKARKNRHETQPLEET